MKLLISTYKYRNLAYNKSLKIEEVDNGSILPLYENKGGVVNEREILFLCHIMMENGLN